MAHEDGDRLPLVTASATLLEALEAIDRGACGLACIVDGTGALVGVVTDGNVRRALLAGNPLSSAAIEVATANPQTVSAGTPRAHVLDLMKSWRLSAIPEIDADRRVRRVHSLSDVVGRTTLPNAAVIMAGGKGTRLGSDRPGHAQAADDGRRPADPGVDHPRPRRRRHPRDLRQRQPPGRPDRRPPRRRLAARLPTSTTCARTPRRRSEPADRWHSSRTDPTRPPIARHQRRPDGRVRCPSSCFGFHAAQARAVTMGVASTTSTGAVRRRRDGRPSDRSTAIVEKPDAHRRASMPRSTASTRAHRAGPDRDEITHARPRPACLDRDQRGRGLADRLGLDRRRHPRRPGPREGRAVSMSDPPRADSARPDRCWSPAPTGSSASHVVETLLASALRCARSASTTRSARWAGSTLRRRSRGRARRARPSSCSATSATPSTSPTAVAGHRRRAAPRRADRHPVLLRRRRAPTSTPTSSARSTCSRRCASTARAGSCTPRPREVYGTPETRADHRGAPAARAVAVLGDQDRRRQAGASRTRCRSARRS